MRRALFTALALTQAATLIAAPGTADAQAPGTVSPHSETELRRAAETITARDYYDRISVIAHDSMMGRDTPSPGLEMTAVWIASEFQRFGLEPGGDDGTYIQRYGLNMVAADFEGSRVIAEGGPELEFGRDVGFPFGATDSDPVEGGVVAIGGTGDWQQAIPAMDLEGKHVVWVLPAGVTSIRGSRDTWQMRRAILDRNPASVMLVASGRSQAEWDSGIALQAERTSLSLPWDPSGGPAYLDLRAEPAEALLAAGGVEMDALADRGDERVVARTLAGVTVTVETAVRVVEAQSAPNVVGVLEGSDPELKDEFVVFSGHMDHVGVGNPDASGDSIFNGADDDASGTIAVVEVAEAMASLETAPRRSMIFLLVSGEEKGLWGSRYFAENPSVPVSQMVANMNMDMVGRNWPDTIVAIGKEHSDLGVTLNTVNERHPELNMTAIDDRWPEERFYFRSDHYNFARKGVPVLFFFNGTHEDYHRPSDEVDKIDTDKAARISRLLFYLSVEVANADERPQWNPQSYREIVSDGQ
jgi:hypothetical protein